MLRHLSRLVVLPTLLAALAAFLVGPDSPVQAMEFRSGDTVTVPAGTTIKWTNGESIPHTVTASDRSFDSGVLQLDGTFSHTFSSAGSFQYLCSIHPEQMTATVTVTN